MKIAVDRLRRFVALPADPREVRVLFDDLGLEVKRVTQDPALGPCFTLELLANRGDHHGYAGLATEVRGRTGAPVSLPAVSTIEVGPSPIPLVDEAGDLLLTYTATLLERRGPTSELDADEVLPILAAGQERVSAPVDATNLANLEFGQPTHAFDADRIDGEVFVRVARPGEKAWPLFAKEPVTLPLGALVIADRSKVLAIAGVIGCEESKTTAETTRILLESATFDPVAVRKAARALNLHTDSAARFERGGDPSAPLLGAGRVVHLLERHGWRRVGTTGVIGDWRDPVRVIAASAHALSAFLDHPMTGAEVAERLERYGFAVTDDGDPLAVRVPPHRLWDVDNFNDLAEELAKSIGFNATPEGLPVVAMGSQPSAAEQAKDRVDEVLVGNGFFEVFTDGFYAREVRDRLGVTESHALWEHVETENAIDRGYSLLKNNALAQAVDTVAVNLRLHTKAIRAYEWTRTFHPRERGLPEERKVLWAIASGPAPGASWAHDERVVDVHLALGLVDELGTELGLRLKAGAPDLSQPLASLLHPNRQAAIRLGTAVVGIVGEVHPTVLSGYKIKRERPVYLQLDATALLRAGAPAPFVEPPEVQVVTRDLAFTLPHRFAAGDVATVLAAGQGVTRVAIADLFAHEQDGQPVRTITYTLSFAPERTPTAEELNALVASLIDAVSTKFGSRGVALRV